MTLFESRRQIDDKIYRTKHLAGSYGACIQWNCSLFDKSNKLGTFVDKSILFNFSYGPISNFQDGRHFQDGRQDGRQNLGNYMLLPYLIKIFCFWH